MEEDSPLEPPPDGQDPGNDMSDSNRKVWSLTLAFTSVFIVYFSVLTPTVPWNSAVLADVSYIGPLPWWVGLTES